MKDKVIETKNIALKVSASDWIEAIKLAGKLLYKNKYIKKRYIDDMISAVKELGPYIVLAPGIAFAHSRPDSGVIKTGISMITLKKPVKFGNKDNDPVNIVFAIAAKDNSSHVNMLKKLSSFLDSDQNIDFLKNENNSKNIAEKINNY
ncbi:MAG: PTS sugar transporter subunit IIA [Bacillota bacterium]